MKRLILIALLLTGCSAQYVPDIKEHAAETFKQAGFEIIGYEGYQWSSLGQYGGTVWYTLKKGNITYEAAIAKWDGEYHIYSLKAIDAIGPKS